MQFRRGRRHHLEVGELTAGCELAGHFGEQGLLAIVLQVVDGQSRDDHVEPAQRVDGSGHVPRAAPSPAVAGEAARSPGHHGRGRVHGHHPVQAGPGLQRQRRQPPIAATEVQQRGGSVGEHRAQHVFAGLTRGQPLDPGQIPLDQELVAPGGGGTGVGKGDRCHGSIVPYRGATRHPLRVAQVLG